MESFEKLVALLPPLEAFEKPLALLIAAVLIAMAGYFARRQRITMRMLRGDLGVPSDQRRYLLKQVGRRLFGSLLMVLLAALLIGSMFLDYEPMKQAAEQPGADPEAHKQAARFLILYCMTMLLVLMVVLALAVFDFWATARFGVQQQKQLAQEHLDTLQADLARLRQRRAEMN